MKLKALILGGTGMLGHRLFEELKSRHETRVTLRRDLSAYRRLNRFTADNAFGNVDVRDFQSVSAVIDNFRPEVIVNCTGITNKDPAARDCIANLEVNALFPQRLARYCEGRTVKIIHLSTDCVFSGRKGGYRETDTADAGDLYGRTKLLGEVTGTNSLSIRTSMIGLELCSKHGLLEWFLAQTGRVHGYQKAIFSGFTTQELSRIIESIILSGKKIPSLLHVAGYPISKYDLLFLIKDELGLQIDLVPDSEFRCDRSLDATVFQKTFGYTPPTWPEMIHELCKQIKRERR